MSCVAGGGKPWFLAYVMKRIPKGWIFRAYPRDFEAVIEGPSYEVRCLQKTITTCAYTTP